MTTVPAGWQLKRLGDIAKVYSGGTPSRTKSSYWGGDIPWASTAEIGSSTITSTKEMITEEGLANSAAKIAPTGTLLMAMYGQGKTRGKTSILGINAAMNQACAAIEPSLEVDARYLLAYLRGIYGQVRALSNSGGQENLSGELVKKIPILFPCIREQLRIADTMTDISLHIECLDHLIAKKQSIKQGMMQELLTGRTRLLGFSESWTKCSLGDLAHIVSGGTPSSLIRDYWNGGIDWCTPSDITRQPGRYLQRTERTISRNGLEHSSAQLLPAGSLLLCSRATIGEIKIALGTVATNQGFKSLIPKSGVSSEYLYYKMLTLKDELVGYGTGSTFLEVSKRDVVGLQFDVPSTREQTAISEALTDIDDEIDALNSRLSKAKAIKQGMMQELLSGRTRLPITEVAS